MLFLLAFLAGALTLFAPCILPVLPFVFARADRPFARTGLPMLAGMALAFAAVASLAAVAGEWAAQVNDIGRVAALVVLAFTGLMLAVPRIAERAMRPFTALGSRLAGRAGTSAGSSVVLGIATGLLWAPCAGPVLGLILTAAAIEGPSARTSLLLLAYAAGAATALAVALLAGQRVLSALRRSLGAGEWVRRALGVAVLAGVATVALGLDAGALAQVPSESVAAIERRVIERLQPSEVNPPAGALIRTAAPALNLPAEGRMPGLTGAVEWLNSPPLTAQQLKGKVVLVNFWTFGCYNCRNALPYVRAWHQKYKDEGLVVIGVHAPEFAFEKNIGNVKRALAELDVPFPVAVDNDFTIWRAFSNRYWPANYFVDAQGQVRFHHFGEGEYEKSERVIRQLLDEAKASGARG